MKALRRLTIVSIVGLLAGCQMWVGAGTPSANSLSEIIDSGELRVGLTGDQPPFNMRARDGSMIGLDVNLAEALGSAMGLEVEFVQLPFADLLPALESTQVDIVISAMTITPERNARVAFAGPYYVSGMAALTKLDELAHVPGIEALDEAGRRYAAVAGTTNESFARDHLPAATLETTADFDAAVELVIAGKVDAVLADYPLCKYAAMRNPNAGFSEVMAPFTIEPFGIAVRADAPLLVNLVQNYLDTLEHTGLLGQLKARWLSDDAWLDAMPMPSENQ